MRKHKRIFIIKVKIRSEIFDRVYGIEDLRSVLNLFNDIHGEQMNAEIEEIIEVKKV